MAKSMFKRVSKPGLIFLRLQHSVPYQTYAGLCWLAEDRGYRNGWISHKFKEIFGRWPSFAEDIFPKLPSEDLVSWVDYCRAKHGQRMYRRVKANSVFAARALDRIEAILAEIEAADRESGGAYRDNDWEPFAIVERIEQQMIANGCQGYDTLAERDMDRESLIERLSAEP